MRRCARVQGPAQWLLTETVDGGAAEIACVQVQRPAQWLITETLAAWLDENGDELGAEASSVATN